MLVWCPNVYKLGQENRQWLTRATGFARDKNDPVIDRFQDTGFSGSDYRLYSAKTRGSRQAKTGTLQDVFQFPSWTLIIAQLASGSNNTYHDIDINRSESLE